MPPAEKSAQKSQIRIASLASTRASYSRLISALKKREKESARSVEAINRDLDALETDYQKRLLQLIGRECLSELKEIKKRSVKLTVSQKERRALSALEKCGVHPAQILELRLPYLKKTRDIIARDASRPDLKLPHDELCDGPVMTYVPPYNGWYWSYYWRRWSSPRDPIIGRYLDSVTGRVGSRIRTPFVLADDFDRVYVEYQTGVSVWHTPQKDGPLEVELMFSFTNGVFEGEVTDKMWADSGITHVQFAEARMTATDSQNPNQYDDGLYFIDSFVHSTGIGEDHKWSKLIANPPLRVYPFRTTATFYQGSAVLLTAGVKHVTRFTANDEGVETNANIDLKLIRIDVRSCDPDIFL